MAALRRDSPFFAQAWDGQDVQQHLTEGKQVKKMALQWKDRLELVLTDTLQLTRLKLDDSVFDQDGATQSEQDPFDADKIGRAHV